MERRDFIGKMPAIALGLSTISPATPAATATSSGASAYVTVKDFGALGDGVTDDTAAIQAAINASTGRSLFFPDGTYRISSALVISLPIEIFGTGTRSATIFQSLSSTGVFWINGGANIISGITISGLILNGTGGSSCYGIDQSVLTGGTVYDLAIRNIEVGAGLTGGIRLQSVYYGIIENVVVTKVGPQDGGLVFRGLDNVSEVVNVRVQNVSVRSGNGGYGLYIGSYAQGLQFFMCLFESSGLLNGISIVNDLAAPRPPENLFFTQVVCDTPMNNGLVISGCYSANFVDCWFASAVGPASSGVGHGIYVASGDEIIFNACRILNNANDGARVDQAGRFVRFVGCSVFSNGTTAKNTYDGISFRALASDFEVVNCNFARGGSAPWQRYSVSVYYGMSDRYVISNNLLGGALTAAVYDGGTGTNKVVTNNVLSGP